MGKVAEHLELSTPWSGGRNKRLVSLTLFFIHILLMPTEAETKLRAVRHLWLVFVSLAQVLLLGLLSHSRLGRASGCPLERTFPSKSLLLG